MTDRNSKLLQMAERHFEMLWSRGIINRETENDYYNWHGMRKALPRRFSAALIQRAPAGMEKEQRSERDRKFELRWRGWRRWGLTYYILVRSTWKKSRHLIAKSGSEAVHVLDDMDPQLFTSRKSKIMRSQNLHCCGRFSFSSPLEAKSICPEKKIIIKKRNSWVGEIKSNSWSTRKGKRPEDGFYISLVFCSELTCDSHLVPATPAGPNSSATCAWRPHADGRPEEPGAITIPKWFSCQISLRKNVHGVYIEVELPEEILFHFSLGCEKRILTLIHWGLQNTLS